MLTPIEPYGPDARPEPARLPRDDGTMEVELGTLQGELRLLHEPRPAPPTWLWLPVGGAILGALAVAWSLAPAAGDAPADPAETAAAIEAWLPERPGDALLRAKYDEVVAMSEEKGEP